jgi:hypothetical protein
MCAPSLWRTEVTPECKSDSVEWIAVPPESLALWDKVGNVEMECVFTMMWHEN